MTTTTRPVPRVGLATVIAIAIATVAAVSAAIGLLTLGGTASPDLHPATTPSASDDVVVLTVEGVEVPTRQLRVYLWQARSEATEQAGFQNSQAAATEIFDAAVRAAATDVVQFIDASKAGLVPNPSYSSFLTQLEAENARRFDAVQAGEVIYGPEQYSEANYRAYLLGAIKEAMTQVYLADGTITANEFDTEIATIQYASDAYDQLVAAHVARAEIVVTSSGAAMRSSRCPVEGSC